MKADRVLILPLAALLLTSAAPVDHRARLAAANAERIAAEKRASALDVAADREQDAARQAARREAAVAARIEAAAAEIGGAEARVALVDSRLSAQRARLADQQAPVIRLVAALQSLARRPSALALAQPGSTSDAVHVRAILATMMPAVAQRTAAVRGEIARVRALREDASLAAASLRAGRAKLQSERMALVRMEGEHRLRSRDLARGAMFESDRAIALGERARALVDEMAESEVEGETREALAALPGPLPRPAQGDAGAAVSRFAAAPYRLPVVGSVVEGLGEASGAGVRSRGVTLAVRPGVAVVAPAAGAVVFARRFRDYGLVVIVDHGDGWASALTGLGRVVVKPGDRVAQGDPLGEAGPGDSPRIAVELRRHGEPIDLAQLLG